MADHIRKRHNKTLLVYHLVCPVRFLWGGSFWTMGYYVNTVGQYGNLAMLQNYVKKQGSQDYKQIHHETLSLFDQGEPTT